MCGQAVDRCVVVAGEIAAFRVLDLDDAGAHVSEVTGGQRRRHRLLDADHEQAGERKCAAASRVGHPSSQESTRSERAGCRPIRSGESGASIIRKRRNVLLTVRSRCCQACSRPRHAVRSLPPIAVDQDLEAGPGLPARNRPDQDAFGVVDHRGTHRADELQAGRRVRRHHVGAYQLQEVGRGARGQRHHLVGVDDAGDAVGVQLLDRAGPRGGDHHPVEATFAVAGRLVPPLLELGVLQVGPAGLVAEPGGQPGEAVLFPHVDHPRPAVGRADHAPDAEAELVTLLLRDRAPVRRHVVHVLRPHRTADVDELMCINLVVHLATVTPAAHRVTSRRDSSSRRSPGPSTRRRRRRTRSNACRRPNWRRRARSPRARSRHPQLDLDAQVTGELEKHRPGDARQHPAVQWGRDQPVVDHREDVRPGGLQQTFRASQDDDLSGMGGFELLLATAVGPLVGTETGVGGHEDGLLPRSARRAGTGAATDDRRTTVTAAIRRHVDALALPGFGVAGVRSKRVGGLSGQRPLVELVARRAPAGRDARRAPAARRSAAGSCRRSRRSASGSRAVRRLSGIDRPRHPPQRAADGPCRSTPTTPAAGWNRR